VGREESDARQAVETEALPAAGVVGFLRDLPALWDAAPIGRRGLAESLFARIDVLGLRAAHIEPTPAAIARGFAEAFAISSAGCGRGERSETAAADLGATAILPLDITLRGAGCGS
jgi:hypothetical protein